MNGINSEKFSPSPSEVEDSNFESVSDDDINIGQSANHQNASRPVSPELAHKLSNGEKLFRDTIGLPDSYHVSAEHKLLFSTISTNPANSDFPSLHPEGVFIDAFGLEVDDVRYPFSLDHQVVIHKAILINELSDATSADEIYRRLDDGFSMYFVENILQKRYTEEIEKELDVKRLSMINEKTKLNHEQRWYRDKKDLDKYIDQEKRDQEKKRQKQKFENFILANNIMSKEELEKYESEKNLSLKKSANSIANKFSATYEENYPRKSTESEEEYEEKLNKIKGPISKLAGDYLFALALSRIQSLPDRPEFKLFDAEWTQKSMLDMIEKLDQKRVQYISNDGHDANYFKEKLYEEFDKYGKLEGINSVIESLEDKEKSCLVHYGSLVPRYRDAYIHYYKQNDRQIVGLESRIEYLDKNRVDILKRESNKRVQPVMEKLKKRILGVVSPEDLGTPENIVNFYFIPTGIITRSKAGPLKTAMITPLDGRILEAFDDKEIKDDWINAWLTKQTGYNKIAFDVLQRDVENNIMQARDEVDNEIINFGETNQIQMPKTFDASTGRIHGDLQPDVLHCAESIIANIKGFVYGLDISTTEVSKTLRSTRLEILNFLSGDSDGDNLMLCGHNNLKINSIYELFTNTESEKQDKAYSRILSEMGIMLYTNLSKSKAIEYRELVGNATNVSDMAFFRAYRRMIPNSAIRRKIVERTVFLKDFIDYIKGEATPTKAEFFDSLKKKPALRQEIQSNIK